MKPIKVTNHELVLLQAELVDLLEKELTYAQKFLALDLNSDIQSKLESFYKLQSELFKEHATASEDGNQVKFNNEDGIKLYNELLLASSEVKFNNDLFEAIKDLKTGKIPVVLYKLHKETKD